MTKFSDNQSPKLTFAESAAPSTPASGLGYLYEKTDGKLYFKNDAGTEVEITASGAATAAWTSYTPTWIAAVTNPVIGNGTLTGAYLIVGKTYYFRITMIAGSTTTFGSGRWDFLLGGSVTSAAQKQVVSCQLLDSSAVASRGIVAWVPGSGTVCRPVGHDGTINGISSSVPWTWAQSDEVQITGVIEIA